MDPSSHSLTCRFLSLAAVVLGLGAVTGAARAAPGELAALLAARKLPEAEALARDMTARNPRDDFAWWVLAQAVAGDPKKRDALLPQVEQCVAELPQSARCHHAAGTLYASLATSAGLSSGLKYAGRIKDSFLRAVELDPGSYEMRRGLIQFYLQAPGVAGGSVRRAVAQAEAFAALDPPRGRLLRAEVHAYEKEWDAAEAQLAGVQAHHDAQLAEQQQAARVTLGFALLNAKEPQRARQAFEAALAAAPGMALAHLGRGRALLDQQQVDAALVALERSVALDARGGAHYRLGMAYELKGERQKAAAAFEQFLGYRPTGPGADEARKRLAALRGP